MTKKENEELEDDILEEMEGEVEELENNEKNLEDENNEEKIEEISAEDEKCMDTLARTQADFINFKNRVERDKDDMIFFLKQDIFKKILPSIDDLDRIIKATKQENTDEPIYLGAVGLYKKLTGDLKKLGLETFDSVGEEVDPNFHDVMTTVPGKEEGVIVDEFEKGYKIGNRVLRHAKVVVGAGE